MKPFVPLFTTVLLACGTATNAKYQGTPVATLKGQLVGTAASAGPTSSQTSINQPVLLAMAWYPSWAAGAGGGPSSPVNSIVTQSNVSFQGTFPVDFTFSLYDAPPAGALTDLADADFGQGQLGFGLLLAYEDLNGNGELDLIAPDGGPTDQIVGASIGDPSLPFPATGYYVVYLNGSLNPNNNSNPYTALNLQQGYNLVEAFPGWGVNSIPLSSGFSIPLTQTPALNYYACPSAFTAEVLLSTVACGIDPYQGKYKLNIFDTTFSQYVDYTMPDSGLNVYTVMDASLSTALAPIANATVSIGGVSLPYNTYVAATDPGDYYNSETLMAPGQFTVSVSVPGYPDNVFSVYRTRLPGHKVRLRREA